MLVASKYMKDFASAQVQTPAAYVLCQLPTADGTATASQVLLPDVSAIQIIRNQDLSADSCMVAFPDDICDYSGLNPNSRFGACFSPGQIDKKFLVYLGFRGSNFTGTPNFTFQDQALALKFTGYLETDQQVLMSFGNTKTMSLLDLNKQFRFQIYDTFPHCLYGDQTLAYYDPNYDMIYNSPEVWQCDGRRFTQSTNDIIYGSSHIDVAVYVDLTGGLNPADTPLDPSNYSFDYANGIIEFLNGGYPSSAKISVSGNPTYMAPEAMIRHMLVNYANWDPNFLNLDYSGILLPQYAADNQSLWKCINDIAGLTNPRFLPWVIWTDETGMLHFYETRADGPPTRKLINQRDVFSWQQIQSSRQLRTVVRADATVTTAEGDQPVSSIAYDQDNVNKYGLTEPLTLSSDVTTNVRHLSIPQAISYLNLVCAAVLAQNSRPMLSIQAEVWPDFTTQIGDKVTVVSDLTGINRDFLVTGIEEDIGQGTAHQTLTLQEYYDTVNYLIGIPAGVAGGEASTLQTPPPAIGLIDSVRMGTGPGMFAFQNGSYNKDPMTGDQVVPIWDLNALENCAFNVLVNPLPAVAATTNNAAQANQYDYTHLPPGYSWVAEQNSYQQTVYYVQNDGLGYVLYVGPDSVFYRYPIRTDYHITAADASNTWVPAGNAAVLSLGGSSAYEGQAATVYLWQWWYLNLDSSLGTGKIYRPVQKLIPTSGSTDMTTGLTTLAMTASTGQWVSSTWGGAPGPYPLADAVPSYYYNNVIVGCSNVTSPPPGFVSAQPFAGDTTEIGVAYGFPIVLPTSYVGYDKITKGHYCVYAVNSNGATQFLRIPFYLFL